jgi:copper chaperone
MTTHEFHAPDISCDHCKRTIEEGLAGFPGVHSVAVDVGAKEVHVDFDENATDTGALRGRLAEIGYPASPQAE